MTNTLLLTALLIAPLTAVAVPGIQQEADTSRLPQPAAAAVSNGFCCDAGLAAGSWFAAVQILDHADQPFRTEAASRDYQIAAEAVRRWQQRFVGLPRRLVLVTAESVQPLTSADRIYGPACPREPVPSATVAWTQREGQTWSLRTSVGGNTTTVFSGRTLLSAPAVCVQSDRVVVACETHTGGAAVTHVFTQSGKLLLSVPGRRPRLAASADAFLLLTEHNDHNSITLQARLVQGDSVRQIRLPSSSQYNFNADAMYDAAEDRFLVAAETCPAFGRNDLFGQHRDIEVFALDARADEFQPFPAAGHRLPDPHYAFRSLSVENTPPIRPRLCTLDGRPVLACRRFRYRGMKTFGWDILLSRLTSAGWSRPARVTQSYGLPDTGYAVLQAGQQLVTVLPACDQRGRSSACTNHRVEFQTAPLDTALPDVRIPPDRQGEYILPEPVADIAPPPQRPQTVPAEFQLVFGDTHQHSAYSKCTSAYNGMPDEVLRYERDVLDLDVLCLSEHGHFLSAPSMAYTLDQAEAAAGEERILLYATEPGTTPGRHTNYFSVDRDIFERLQLITLGHRYRREAVYRQIHQDLPAGSVLAARHFHGNAIRDKQQLVASFDPEIEVAMEAMQGRVNAMLPGPGNGRKPELFPTNFLNAGCRLGIIGGTDHYRGEGPNHYCLTGFWVREKTAAGVMEALRARRTTGMADAKIGLWATLDGAPMGSELTVAGPIEIRAEATAARGVTRACLIRDGLLLPWQPVVAGEPFTLTDPAPRPGPHWYVVTVEAPTAYDDTAIAHASPFFVNVTPHDP